MTDAADHPTQPDSLLCRDEIVARLGGALRKESRNILLAGPWGSGKTTLLEGEAFERALEEHVAAGPLRPWKVLTFSPWEETAHQDCAAGFLRFLALEVAKAEAASDVSPPLPERLVAESKKIWQVFLDLAVEAMPYLKDAVAAVPGGTLAFWLARLTAKLYAQREHSRADAEGVLPPLQMRVLRGQMRLLLERLAATHGAERILLIVDDLDRARPDEAVAVLDSLYHLFLPQPKRQRPAGNAEEAWPTGREAKIDKRSWSWRLRSWLLRLFVRGRSAAGDAHPSALEDAEAASVPSQDPAKWPLSSIWAVNIAMLEEFLYEHYRRQPSFDPTAYLEKLFHCRVNVPPLFQSADSEEPLHLWRQSLSRLRDGILRDGIGDPELANCFDDEVVAPRLSHELSYAVLGNLRLYHSVRESCCEYWRFLIERADAPADPVGLTPDQLLRDAQALTLVQAYPGFREAIALYDGMWPHFMNRVNARLRQASFEMVENPAYRHIDDPNLLTLLMDLGAVHYDQASDRYLSVREGQQRLSRELGQLLRAGF